MPSTIIGLCSSYIVVPIITSLNNLFKNKNIDKFNKMVRNMMLSLIFIGVLAFVFVDLQLEFLYLISCME